MNENGPNAGKISRGSVMKIKATLI